MYNLYDGEEDSYEDGALGGFSVKDDFDVGLLSDEDLQEDDLQASESKRLKHLNKNKGHEPSGEGERHKSKKEIYEEIIMKSKLGRMEKAKHKEEKKKLIDQVDKEFMSLGSEMLESLGRRRDISEVDMESQRLGRPIERTKAPEEIAQEERQN